MIAELKTLNASPLDRTEQRLKERFAKPDVSIVFACCHRRAFGGCDVVAAPCAVHTEIGAGRRRISAVDFALQLVARLSA